MHRQTLKNITLKRRFLFFGRNSSLHGLNHVFRKNTLILARLFWISTVLVSSGFLYLILAPVLERGNEVNYTPDTRYLPWTTTFPAVTVCEILNLKMAQRKFAALYRKAYCCAELMEPLSFDLRKYLTELVYGRGTCSKTVCIPCGNSVPCDVPWRDIIDSVHKKCTEMLSDCRFNEKHIPCCEKFQAVDSEYGYCFSFNTLQSENSMHEPLFTVNLTTGPGLLSFRVLSDAQISVHSPEELSTNVLDSKFKFDVRPGSEKRVEYLFSEVEMDNDPVLTMEDTRVRRCQYLDEVLERPLHKYRVYSYGACRLALETEDLFLNCGCVHPVRHLPYKNMYCNFTGLNCLVAHLGQKLKLGVGKQAEDVEHCLPSCGESELTTIHISRAWLYDDTAPGTLVNIRMSALPTLRYSRNLIRNELDFVVSVGGIVGLFFGASVLSIAEILYLLCRSQKRDIR